jgi:hypothetical protein
MAKLFSVVDSVSPEYQIHSSMLSEIVPRRRDSPP